MARRPYLAASVVDGLLIEPAAVSRNIRVI
jgi:hypothetical protein